MDFLKMKFSELFLKKHGKDIFDNICKQIKEESKIDISEDYIEIIFKISLLDFFGLNNSQIQKFLKEKESVSIDVNNLQKIHKKSISNIIKYVKEANNQQS